MFKSNKKLVIAVILCFALIGCTHYFAGKSKTEGKIDKIQEEQINSVKFWNWLSSHALALNTNKNQFTDIAERSTDNITDLIGIPAKSNQVEVKKLLPTDTKLSVKQIIEKQLVEKQLSDRESKDSKLQQDLKILEEEKRILTEKLTAYGAKFEEERNKSINWRIWTWGSGTLIIAGIITLFVFCPALIPVALGILKWIFAKFVSLVNYVVPALSNTIKGIGETRKTLKIEAETNKTLPDDKKIVYTPDEVLDLIDTELHKAQDSGDKTLVEKIRKKVNV